MLEIAELSAGYGPVRALDKVSFTAERGKITAVLGANGAGKTTLLRTISGLVRPDHGSVRMGDTKLTGLEADRLSRLGLAHVPEGRGVITELTVEDNLRLGALGGRGRKRIDLAETYEMFPKLAERRHNAASTLSGGERQMLVIARAVLAEPTVLLLDEPSLGLAPRIVSQIFALVRQLVDEREMTVVLVEQNARSALQIADHGIVLNLGRVVGDSPAADLAGDDTLRHAYLGF
ncbi:branched-chain amino acid transport system ATP-binding protein [Naumannella cuiyingiana]|uniref:Branched-chain amino acid transport system ATP-binding protein n=1 Tax=Naumannella cuiyingiana TaxID=1347891 RepID=A0A7Z0D705_9ACTN|nr:ABC transporter ATP-binding protein [Naumannella cuiyingiana]NYI70003.1 branched-chain amino acid transport system ATP-binding protein [Naumannella cuiyingiana]